MRTKYKHLTFTESTNPGKKTKRFWVRNHDTNYDLGYVEWDHGWRQYVYITPYDDGAIRFSRGCLEDIRHFLQQLMDERKK